MSFKSPYEKFVFEDMSFDKKSATAKFVYSFDSARFFTEEIVFPDVKKNVNMEVLNSALELAFWISGVSYYKAFPTKSVVFKTNSPNREQASFLATVYSHGLSQFVFENDLKLDQLATFTGSQRVSSVQPYEGEGAVVLQSGGKDSLLLATLLEEQNTAYQPWYISSSKKHPHVLDRLSYPLKVATRTLDVNALKQAKEDGALNGHVPVTYIVLSLALVQAVLSGRSTVLAAIGVEGEEPHAYVDELPVNHQWSKTWSAEQLLASYVDRFISPDLQVGSPLRAVSELRIAELFAKYCWQKYGNEFSSCNSANYQQGADNTVLTWCANCPKCANSYLLFAPFVSAKELNQIFSGKNLFAESGLQKTFKGLLGIDDVMKPFECVGEVAELRLAYRMTMTRHAGSISPLPFKVPGSDFDYKKLRESQPWTKFYIAPVY